MGTAFNLMFLGIIYFIFVLVKPKAAMFWMKNPDKLWGIAISAALFMGGMVLFGEYIQSKESKAPQTTKTSELPSIVPETEK